MRRHNIVFGTITGESGDVSKRMVSDWLLKLPDLCQGYAPVDVFNMDETGLIYRATTNTKTFHVKGTT